MNDWQTKIRGLIKNFLLKRGKEGMDELNGLFMRMVSKVNTAKEGRDHFEDEKAAQSLLDQLEHPNA